MGRIVMETENGVTKWFKNGVLHREDGPAVQYPDGRQYWYCKYHINAKGDAPFFSNLCVQSLSYSLCFLVRYLVILRI